MNRSPVRRFRALGLYPNRFGSAYAVVESHARLLAYGQLRLRPRTTEEFCAKFSKLVSRYNVHTLVFEQDNIKRPARVRELIRDAICWAVIHGSRVETFAPDQVKVALGLRFDDTKRGVIHRLAEAFPELQWHIRGETFSANQPNDVFWAIALATAGSVMSPSEPATKL